MQTRWGRLSRIIASCVALALFAAEACSTTINVSVSSPGFAAASATLAFDFIDGGPPDNTVTLSALTSNGTQGSTSTSGSVSGTGPWVFSDATPFNELLVSFNPLGTTLTFSFTTSDNPPAANPPSFPDSFSFFLLDAAGVSPLITTDAPGGSNALFQFDITGFGAEGLTVYTPVESGFSVLADTGTTVPEPGSLALLVAALGAFNLRRRPRP